VPISSTPGMPDAELKIESVCLIPVTHGVASAFPSPESPLDQPIFQDLVPIPRVWERMDMVESRLMEVSVAETPFLTEIAQHLLVAGGKRYRPLLSQVAAELGTSDSHETVEAGVAVELVHLGSLYHDDVIDEADARRGKASVNANWTNTIAILAGDFLLARASEIAAPLGEEAVALIARTYATLCEGQVSELVNAHSLDHGSEGYYTVIGGKTASLIRTSARLGAMTGGADKDTIEAISEWAWEMGMVFQITDDVLDLIASDEFLGKPAGSDIGEGTFTLPVLLAADGPEGSEMRSLLAGRGPYSREAIRRVIELTVAGGYIDIALDECEDRIRRAEKAADQIPADRLKAVLHNLDQYLMDRVASARK
jgi:heptaprenyl diphosphate synthase